MTQINKIGVLILVAFTCSAHICEAKDTKIITVKNENRRTLYIRTGRLKELKWDPSSYGEVLEETAIAPLKTYTFTIQLSYPKKNRDGLDLKGADYTGGEILFSHRSRGRGRFIRDKPFATYSVSSLANGTTFVVKDSGITKTP